MVRAARGGDLVTYDDWVRIGSDLVDAELAKDDRPIVLYGLSAGGMETYHVAAVNKHVAGIVGMTFLDQRSRQVRVETAFDPVSGLLGSGLMEALAKTPLRGLRLPMRLVSKMRALVNDPAADRWTPLHLSAPFLAQIKQVPAHTVQLDNAGHYPLEQPGLDQLVTAIDAFCGDRAKTK